MTTAFLALANAMQAALLASPALAGGRVSKNRQRPVASAHADAVVVRMESSAGQEVVLGMHDWSTSFAVECYGRGTTGTDAAESIDVLLAAVWARLAVLDVAALGVMQVALNPEITWDYDDAETPLVCATFRLQVTHRTAYTVLT